MVKSEASLRKEAEAVQCLEKEGHYELALARVDELASRHAGSALVLHLAGRTHHAASSHASAASDEVATAHHAAIAERYLAEAKRLVPNCVGISALLARVLFERGEFDEADQEARRAIDIPNPADPADNNVVYAHATTTRNERVETCRESARDVSRSIEAMDTSSVREVLEFDTDQRDGMTLAIEKAMELASRRPNSSRAQLLCAYMKLQFARGLDATMDRRPILDPIRFDMNVAAKRFDTSLVLAMFHAKLCFVLGLYGAALRECLRAFSLRQPVDPKLEDVPPGSINGGVYDDRLSSIYQDLSRLKRRLLLVAKAHWCLMTSEQQDGFLSVGLDELHKYYDEVYEDGHWATRTISDALTSVKKTGSWRFWICPYCIGKLPDAHSLLEHMCSKHPAEKVLRSVLDPKLSDDTSVDDNSLDEISVCKDSEDHYLFHFNKTDNIFDRLFCSTPSITEAKSFAEIQEEKCKEGKEILQKLKQKLKNLPKNKLSAEFVKARPEIQELLHDFLVISALDYRIVILTLMKSFLWTKLMKSLSEDDATSKRIDNADIDAIFADIDAIFPEVAVVHGIRVEDRSSGAMVNKKMPASCINMAENQNKIAKKLGRFEKDIYSIVASGTTGRKYQRTKANENAASNQLGEKPGSCSRSSEETTSMFNYRGSSFVLYEEQTDIFSLHSIIQILWNLRPFRDDFLKRQPVCSQSCHDAPCIAQILYKIFSNWEKNYYQKISYPLISLRNAICQVLSCSNSFQNVGENISPYIVAAILSRLHMPCVFMHSFSKLFSDGNTGEPVSQPVNPAKVICTKQISCGCQTCLGVKESTASGNKLDADSLQTAKDKSFAEDKCEQFGLKDVDLFFLDGTVFSTIVCYCSSERETQDMLRKWFDSIIDNPGSFEFYCSTPYVHSTTEDTMKCTIVSMICYQEGQLVTFARAGDKWLVYEDNEGLQVFSSREDLKNCCCLDVHPGVLFLKVIK